MAAEEALLKRVMPHSIEAEADTSDRAQERRKHVSSHFGPVHIEAHHLRRDLISSDRIEISAEFRIFEDEEYDNDDEQRNYDLDSQKRHYHHALFIHIAAERERKLRVAPH